MTVLSRAFILLISWRPNTTKGPWDSQDAKWKSQDPHMTHGRKLRVEQSLLLHALWSSTGILKARTGIEPSYNVPGLTLCNVFPPARLHLPKVPLPSQASTVVWGSNVHAHEPMGDILHLNHSAKQLWIKLTSSFSCFLSGLLLQ